MPFFPKYSTGSSSGSSSTTSGLVTYNATRPILADGGSEPIQGDSLGNQYVNPGIANTGSHTHTNIAVSASAGGSPLLAANPSRTGLMIQNQDASNAIYVRVDGVTPTVANGFKIPANSLYEWPQPIPNGAISAIASTSNSNTHIMQSS